MFYVYAMCMFCKSPEMTLCGWRGYKPSINKQASSSSSSSSLRLPVTLSCNPLAEMNWIGLCSSSSFKHPYRICRSVAPSSQVERIARATSGSHRLRNRASRGSNIALKASQQWHLKTDCVTDTAVCVYVCVCVCVCVCCMCGEQNGTKVQAVIYQVKSCQIVSCKGWSLPWKETRTRWSSHINLFKVIVMVMYKMACHCSGSSVHWAR